MRESIVVAASVQSFLAPLGEDASEATSFCFVGGPPKYTLSLLAALILSRVPLVGSEQDEDEAEYAFLLARGCWTAIVCRERRVHAFSSAAVRFVLGIVSR
ncbi:hypothetical protein MRX96_005692 [Rhipicephalus microplus]